MDDHTKKLIQSALEKGDRIELTESRESVKIYRVSRKLVAELPKHGKNPNLKKQY